MRPIHTPISPPQATAAAVLELQGIDLSFGGIHALRDIELRVAPGEIRAIIGPNGAGKSSLLNIISGLYQPSHGSICIDGKQRVRMRASRLARLGVARTFQNLALFKGLSVRDNIALGRVTHTHSSFVEQMIGVGRARREWLDARDKAQELIDFVGLGAVQDQLSGTLAYGVQKRVELARALVARPRLLLLDEPLAGMTMADKLQLVHLIRSARDQWGLTILLIEHDIGIVLGLSDQVAVLDYGRKIADGKPEQIRNDQAVIDAYLGVAHQADANASFQPSP